MKENQSTKLGALYAIIAYVLWGVLPIYWKFIDHVGSGEILAHRIIWSFVFMIVLITIVRAWPEFVSTCRDMLLHKRRLLAIICASLVISLNWLTYIWAVNNDYIIQASLGYYMNPLISILLAVVVLREKLSAQQVFSVILASVGVILLTVHAGVFPWVSIWLAVSFAIYGLIKKVIHMSAMFSLTIETMMVTPIALVYLSLLPKQTFTLNVFTSTHALLIGAGVMTAIPLLLFAKGAQSIPLSLIGFLQYIAPTIMLILGIFVYNETFSLIHLLAFSFIWIALIIYLISIYRQPAMDKTPKVKYLS
ncbi:chloramphenicol-sensitive protein RarD [Cerasibacillus quisquiliarum]|uniref:Transporter n=1 Tax=Cerasibacillus quisquiliarum TaxID=227865 RepID=A0A511V2B2_9BACI|nr:EamA family transporter RarD [Cerasibacillus quisquiliarum]MBB5146040.1 chloramphenicol-sensitive protein RarD [Cerasibacillus quisquiliarum]GEN32181.1 transporter [Cerasibacillus quisquiliarum]